MDNMNKFSKYFLLARKTNKFSVEDEDIQYIALIFAEYFQFHIPIVVAFFLRYFYATFSSFFSAFVYLCDMEFLYVGPFLLSSLILCCSVVLKFVFMFGRRPGYRAGLIIDKDILVGPTG